MAEPHDHQHDDEHEPSAASPEDAGRSPLEEPSPFDPAEPQIHTTPPPEPVDPAQQSLADALQFSFTALKAIMVLLLIGYLFTGVFPVDEQEVAVRLRFGKIVGEDRIYSQGWHFGLPVPIESRVEVSTASRSVQVNEAFWYEVTEQQAALNESERASQLARPLNPERDGSLVTGDGNIVHARFNASYRVPGDAPDAVIDFVRNVATAEKAEEMVRAAIEEGALYAAAQSTTDGFINNDERIRIIARQRAQQTLDQLRTGLRIETLSAETVTPNAVIQAFNAVSEAESQRGSLIDAAEQDATRTLGGVAGIAAEPLFDLVRSYELARSARDEFLAPRLDGVLALCFDQLLVPDRVGELVEAADAYRAAVIDADESQVQQLRERIDQLVTRITSEDPREVLKRTFESYVIALQAQREDEAARLSEQIRQRINELADSPELADIASAYEKVLTRDDREARLAAALELLEEAQSLEEAIAEDGVAIGGEVAQQIYQAQSYRTTIVNQVQSEAERFNRLLAEYQRNPRIVRSRLWQDTREEILSSEGVETMYTLPGDIRLDINRDPEVRRERERRALQGEDEELEN
ncbi:MAG: SPFH domain-containing protein [Phycisphaeraceae bacterium]